MNNTNILSARYAKPLPPGGYHDDAAVIAVHATYGEQHRRANDDIDDGGMLAFLAAGGVIGPYVAPPVVPPTAADVRAEAQRRIIEAIGARDMTHCITKQLNGLMRAAELNNKIAQGPALTAEETAEAAALQYMADSVKAIRAVSNEMEEAPPEDFAHNDYWPSF